MDRAKFLRGLPFLRRLPPGAWDVCENESDSTSTGATTLGGGTPLKGSAAGLLEGATFAASIEPRWMDAPTGGDGGVNISAATGNGRRKRDRGGGEQCDDGRSVGVAYFASSPPSEESVGNADSETNSVGSDGDENHYTTFLHELNADPAMSSFELAIVNLPMSAMGGDGSVSSSQNGAVATPTKTSQGGLTTEEMKDALLFRFGHHFVFQCDSRYIEELSLTAKVSSNESEDGPSNGKNVERSPPAKRKKDGDDSSVATKTATKPGLPPSLAIHFSCCVIRVFPIDSGMKETKQSKIWEALATRPESSESILENAMALIEQRLGISGDRMWEMAPCGSADSFIKWPHFDDIYLNDAQCVSTEDWPYCLSRNSKRVQCETPSSPEKSSSTSKPSSGSALEQGQREPTVSLFDDTQSTKGDNNQNRESQALLNGSQGARSQSGARKSPRRQKDQSLSQSEDNFDKSRTKSQGRKTTECESKNENSPGVEKELVEKRSGCRDGDGASVQSQSSLKMHGSAMKQAGRVSVQLSEENLYSKAIEQQYIGKIVTNYRQFEDSSLQMDAAMQNKSFRMGMLQSAQSLSESYMTMDEFKTATENCEADIQGVTVEMEQSLTGLRNKRGDDDSADAVDPVRIEELMSRRKKAVAAKIALLLVPKR